jgi:hypothetical protein
MELFLDSRKSKEVFFPPKPPERFCAPRSFRHKKKRELVIGVKRRGLEADFSPAYSSEVKNEWSCTSAPPPYAFLAWT